MQCITQCMNALYMFLEIPLYHVLRHVILCMKACLHNVSSIFTLCLKTCSVHTMLEDMFTQNWLTFYKIQIGTKWCQKLALKIILGNSYTSYTDALKWTGLETLAARRTKVCLNFARKCTKYEKTEAIFLLNDLLVDTRNHE